MHAAIDRRSSRRVAIKTVRHDSVDDQRLMDIFFRELKALGQLSHPHIVQLLDYGIHDDGHPFLVMELADGESLKDTLATAGSLSAQRTVNIARQIAWALAAAHERGVIHRDVKPSNIVLLSELGGRNDVVKLLDFGVSSVVRDSLDLAETALTNESVVGTPTYVSPEQARGETVGAPSDLYSFGVLLYHMLTGNPPFRAETAMGLLYHHVHSPPVAVHRVVPEAPEALCGLVMELLAKAPQDRPASAVAVLDRLEAIELGGGVLSAAVVKPRPTTTWLMGAGVLGAAAATAILMTVSAVPVTYISPPVTHSSDDVGEVAEPARPVAEASDEKAKAAVVAPGSNDKKESIRAAMAAPEEMGASRPPVAAPLVGPTGVLVVVPVASVTPTVSAPVGAPDRKSRPRARQPVERKAKASSGIKVSADTPPAAPVSATDSPPATVKSEPEPSFPPASRIRSKRLKGEGN